MCVGCGQSESDKKQVRDGGQKELVLAPKPTDSKVQKGEEVPVLIPVDTITVEVNRVLDGSDLSEGIDVACSDDGRFLCVAGGIDTGGAASKLRLTDVSKKKEVSTIDGVSFYGPSVVLAKDASWVLFRGGTSAEVWEMPAVKRLRRLGEKIPGRLVSSPERDVVISIVSFGSNKGGIGCWSPNKEEPLFIKELEPQPFACALLPDKSQIAAWHDGTIRIWDTKSWQTIKAIPIEKQRFYEVTRLAASPDGNFLVAGEASSGKIRVFSRKAEWKMRELEGSFGRDQFYFIPGSNLLAYRKSKLSSGDIALQDLETGEDKAILRGHKKDLPKDRDNVIWGMTATSDGRTLFSVCGLGEIRVWDLKKSNRKTS